jgi:hypothetical protein
LSLVGCFFVEREKELIMCWKHCLRKFESHSENFPAMMMTALGTTKLAAFNGGLIK